VAFDEVNVEDICITVFRNITQTGKDMSTRSTSKCNDVSRMLIGFAYMQILVLCQLLIT
jgi:hypothetical protein